MLVEVRRTRTPAVPAEAVAGTVKLTVLLELEVPVAITVFVATCSPESVSTPLRLKSIQTLRKTEAPLVLVTLTVMELAAPSATLAGSVTPSSSSMPVMSSPEAAVLAVMTVSVSVVAPILMVLTWVLLALPKRE